MKTLSQEFLNQSIIVEDALDALHFAKGSRTSPLYGVSDSFVLFLELKVKKNKEKLCQMNQSKKKTI
jgi:hypothetical protein